MDSYELIKKLFESLNKLISINVKTTKYSNELIETLKIIENCTSCKKVDIKENDFDEFHKLINKIKSEQSSKELLDELNKELIKIDVELNKKVLCEG